MTRTSITYSESIETFHGFGLRKWRKAEVSANLQPDENVMGCLEELKREVQEFLQSPMQVSPEEALDGVLPIQQVQKPEETRIGLLAEDIMSCPDLTILETYRPLVKGKPEFQKAYDTRYQQLANQPTP